jgi:hypothetical protein
MTTKHPNIAKLFADEAVANAVLATVKKPKTAAAPPAEMSQKATREWMRKNASEISATTKLPNGQTAGEFLVAQWKERVHSDK